MYRHFWKIVLGIILIVMLAAPVGSEPLSHKQLDHQASSFLERLDQHRYGEAWQSMSDYFRVLSDKTKWQNRQQAIRNAYGAVLSRQFYRIDYRQSYTLSPDGQYVIVQYKSIFQNKSEAVETVVLDCRNLPKISLREYVIQ